MASGFTVISKNDDKVKNEPVNYVPKSEKFIGADSGEPSYFFEDEVFCLDRKGNVKFGLVTDTLEAYIDDGYDLEDITDALSAGEVRAAFYPDGKDRRVQQAEIGLVDRTLMPGDVVRRINSNGIVQLGYCKDINQSADVKILGTKYVIPNVNAKRLKLLTPWTRDSTVYLDSWVGTIRDVEEKAILKASNGARIEITSQDFYTFKDLHTPCPDIFNPNIFYPGNIVVGRLPVHDRFKNLTPDVYISTAKKGRPLSRFVVESIREHSVWIQWECRALSEDENASTKLKHPSGYITGDDLKRLAPLNLFESCTLQIYDRNFLKYSNCDKLLHISEWKKQQETKYKALLKVIYQEENQNEVESNIEKKSGCESSAHISNNHSNTKLAKAVGKSKKLSHKAMSGRGNAANQRNNENSSTAHEHQLPMPTEDGWVWTEEDVEETDETENVIDVSVSCDTTTVSTCSSPSQRTSPRAVKRRHVKKKFKILKKSLNSPFKKKNNMLNGEELVTEALVVYSTATVVWQDGSVEVNIPSKELYPVNHLDNQAFFPGDFVSSAKEEKDTSSREYGVVQKVDPEARTALVKWFNAYTSLEDPKPTFTCEVEVSVYDLKDHSDFQFNPGTMVVRVAKFADNDAGATAGQIIDNFTDGRVEVWWADGRISSSWPQDIFDMGHAHYADTESENSWETESESDLENVESYSAAVGFEVSQNGLEKASKAIAKLKEIFHLCPEMQKPEVLVELFTIYKICRSFDNLLKTSFFHEDNFQGLIKRVGKVVTIETGEGLSSGSQLIDKNALPMKATEFAPKTLPNHTSTPVKTDEKDATQLIAEDNAIHNGTLPISGVKRKCPTDIIYHENQRKRLTDASAAVTSLPSTSAGHKDVNSPTPLNAPATKASSGEMRLNDDAKIQKYKHEYLESIKTFKTNITAYFITTATLPRSQNDSGNFTRSENSASSSNGIITLEAAHAGDTNMRLNNETLGNNKSESSISLEFTEPMATDNRGELFCASLLKQMSQCKQHIDGIRSKNKNSINVNIILEALSQESTGTTIIENGNFVVEIFSADTANAGDVANEAIPSDSTIVEGAADPDALYIPASDCFQILPQAPLTHRFINNKLLSENQPQFIRAIQREYKLLQTSLPPGMFVKAFEDRMDLLCVMIEGPSKTPYEDGVFFFDIQFSPDYPKSPPLCQYISFCVERLNPNLYDDGKVCVSLLGTWTGRDTEVWTVKSTLLQVIVSIQGLILVAEPYYNEAGFEKQKGSQQGLENSRIYNEMAIIKMVQSTTKQLHYPPVVFKTEVIEHFKRNGLKMIERLQGWCKSPSITLHGEAVDKKQPEFPLLPVSRGFCLSLQSALNAFKSALDTILNAEPVSSVPIATEEDSTC